MRRLLPLAAALPLALGACTPEELTDPLPPLDRFYHPTGVAVSPRTGGTALLVASSNFDLRYSAVDGGTLLSVDPAASPNGGPVALLGAQRIASYAGVTVAADARSCGTLSGSPAVLVASRFDDSLYRFELDVGTGALACGAGCRRALAPPARDPFALGLACGVAANRAYVGFLDTPASSRGAGDGAWIAELDLDDPAAPIRYVEVGDGPVRSIAYEPEANRLWLAARPSGARAHLYAVALSDPAWEGSSPWLAASAVDLFPAVRGAELRSVAVGSDLPGEPRRLYVTARLYDAEVQASTGERPGGDVGGVLLVLDVTTGVDGRPEVSVRKVVSLGTGVGDVAVVSRAAPSRDVVVATVLDGDLLVVYDDEEEAVTLVVGQDAQGVPLLGDRPMALAVDQPARGAPAAVYVAAFGGHDVARVDVDPANLQGAINLKLIGGLAP